MAPPLAVVNAMPPSRKRAKRSLSNTRNSILHGLLAFATVFVIAVSPSQAQVPGTDECSCSPTEFEFVLDFGLDCPGTIDENDGIAESSCIVTIISDDVSDLVPVVVSRIDILELNFDDVIQQTGIRGPFEDGDSITYQSISSFGNLTDDYYPTGLQLTLTGENAAGTTVINTWAVEYTNDCDFTPIYENGETIGWVVFEDTGDANSQWCPVAPPGPSPDPPTVAPTEAAEPTVAPTEAAEPTVAPTEAAEPTVAPTEAAEPTVAPTEAAEPTVAPTEAEEPTVAPTEADVPTTAPTEAAEPTVAPTEADEPTAEPTEADVPTTAPTEAEEPTVAPTEEPEEPTAEPTEAPVVTDAPVPLPTDAPIPQPTEAPVPQPTEAPVAEPTDAPVAQPTDAPVPEPTEAPVQPTPTTSAPEPTEAPVQPTPTTSAPRPTEPPLGMSFSYSMSFSMSMSLDYRMLIEEEEIFEFGRELRLRRER